MSCSTVFGAQEIFFVFPKQYFALFTASLLGVRPPRIVLKILPSISGFTCKHFRLRNRHMVNKSVAMHPIPSDHARCMREGRIRGFCYGAPNCTPALSIGNCFSGSSSKKPTDERRLNQPADAGGDIRIASSTSGWTRSLSPRGGRGIGDCITARGISCVGGNWLSSDAPESCVASCCGAPWSPPLPASSSKLVASPRSTCTLDVASDFLPPLSPPLSPASPPLSPSTSTLSPGSWGRGPPSCTRISTTS